MDLQSARSFIATCVAAGALAFSAFACGGGDSATQGGSDPGPGGGFESDNPSGAAAASGSPGPGTGAGGAGGAGGMGGNGGGAGTGSQPPADDPNRAIEEADIIQVDADKLYALSRYGGLSVIDVARPEQLRMLGRFRTEATPFEMYVKSNVVLGLFTEWGRYVTTTNGWQWVQTSQVIALDASDPANIRSLGEFSVPGAISDSRIVGNILYVVSYQNGSCWECASAQPRTVILSLDISNPSAVKKVDELVYDDVNDQWGWGARSITVTDQRMYVGGREWRDGIGGSTIQVIDISNPNGDLVPGTSVQAEGQITSRWQMDEHQGTLRVLSQPWQGTGTPPVLQTYRVESAQSVVPLARMPLVLPRPEQLQSTRFDGTRAYAITFERTDPLFTIDLTNPAAPRQMGELEMPGWIYHMEPRGDRLYGLGFDQNNPAGALNVSIFDVSNLSAPKLVDRVNFGANWGYLPEDQDRIHKAFRLLDEQGLILVPYAGYSYTTHENYCGGSYKSGVQLIDFTRDDLVLRGSAPSYGEARRAFLHRDRLFTVSDDRVQSFDIANRDAPAKLHQVSLAREVLSAAVAGDHLVRLGNDWWSRTAQIDVTPLNGADAPNGLGGLDLESILGSSCGNGFYGARVLGNGNRAYVVYDQYVYEGDGTQKTAVAVIDVSDPAAPRVESHQSIGVPASYAWGGWGYDSVVASGERLIQIGSTLVFAHIEGSWTNGSYVSTQASLVVVDLADPAEPRTAILRLPNAQGLTGLHVDGSTILTSHFEPVAGAPGRVRFYVDRIDVSNPAAPRFVGKVNVPGSLFAWEPETGRAITVDYRRSVEQGVTMQDCYNKGGYGRANWVIDDSLRYDVNATGTCHIVNHSLRQVRIDSATATAEGSWDVPGDLQLGRADVAAQRVYVGLNRSYGYYHDGCYTGGCAPVRAAELLVLSGFELGALRTATLPLTAQPWGGYIYHLLAFGDRALVAADSGSELLVVDASTPTELKTIRTIDTYGYVYSLQKHGDLAIIASGHDGAQVMDVRR